MRPMVAWALLLTGWLVASIATWPAERLVQDISGEGFGSAIRAATFVVVYGLAVLLSLALVVGGGMALRRSAVPTSR